MEAFTGTVQNCAYGKCSYGRTTNRNYSFNYENAYALQTASAGWNTDGGTHCVDWEASSVVYNTYTNRSPDTYSWGTNIPVPDNWVSSWHWDKARSYASGVESYTSSDGNHSSSGWVFPGC